VVAACSVRAGSTCLDQPFCATSPPKLRLKVGRPSRAGGGALVCCCPGMAARREDRAGVSGSAIRNRDPQPLISLVGPAGLPHYRKIHHLGPTETLGNSDVSPCLSQSIVSARPPPDKPKMRSPRTAGTSARADRKIEALNSFDTNENLQLVYDKLQRRFGLSPATAVVIAELALFARCSR